MPQEIKPTLQSVNISLQEILRKMESFHESFTTMQDSISRMDVLVARIPEIESHMAGLEANVKAVGLRLSNLEGLYERLDRKREILGQEYVSISAAVKCLEEKFDRLEADRLAERVKILEEKVSALEKNTVN